MLIEPNDIIPSLKLIKKSGVINLSIILYIIFVSIEDSRNVSNGRNAAFIIRMEEIEFNLSSNLFSIITYAGEYSKLLFMSWPLYCFWIFRAEYSYSFILDWRLPLPHQLRLSSSINCDNLERYRWSSDKERKHWFTSEIIQVGGLYMEQWQRKGTLIYQWDHPNRLWWLLGWQMLQIIQPHILYCLWQNSGYLLCAYLLKLRLRKKEN